MEKLLAKLRRLKGFRGELLVFQQKPSSATLSVPAIKKIHGSHLNRPFGKLVSKGRVSLTARSKGGFVGEFYEGEKKRGAKLLWQLHAVGNLLHLQVALPVSKERLRELVRLVAGVNKRLLKN